MQAPDIAYLHQLIAGWNQLKPEIMTQYYLQGQHTFFDLVPLKFNNWQEYRDGVAEVLKNYKSFKLTVNDDAEINHDGNVAWSSATLEKDAVTITGERQTGTVRWSAVFQKIDGKWLIVHEHTSAPSQ